MQSGSWIPQTVVADHPLRSSSTGVKLVFTFAALLALLLVLSTPAFATSVIPVSDAELYQRSDLVVHGVVLSSETLEGASGYPETVSVIKPFEVLKGKVGENLVLRQLGGTLPDGRFFNMWGRPEYKPGREVVVFAIVLEGHEYQTAEMLLGKFEVARDQKQKLFAVSELASGVHPGVEVLPRELATQDQNAVNTSLDPYRDLQKFLQFLRGGAKDPQSLTAQPNGELRPVNRTDIKAVRPTPNWVGIGEPSSLWRWNSFSSAGWTLTGDMTFASEARDALDTWTNDSNSSISYTEGGSNNLNLGVASKTCGSSGWSACGTSGVVGCGGPNGGGSHTWRGETYNTITGGEVWFRCGGFSSTIAESIILHELGHTLGLGHSNQGASPHDVCPSDENAAIMRSSVQSRTTLGTDDTDAIRWLYGDGNNSCSGSGCTAASISTHPANATINAGSSANLSVTAAGSSPFTYQWYRGASGNTSDPVSGATNNTLNISPSVTTTYWARVTNGCGNANSNAATVTVNTASLNAAFNVSPSNGTAGVTNFVFTDQSTGPLTSRQWNFGDGLFSSSTNPTHVYANPGSYTITLTIFGSGGTQSSTTHNVSVSASSSPVHADFRVSASNGTAGLTNFVFTDRSTGPIVSRLWTFGDGATSTATNPTHVYPNAGTFLVTLTVNGSGGTQSTSQATIVVSAPSPTLNAAFVFSPTTVTTDTTITFLDQSTGGVNSWSWNFGDGTTSTLQSPSKKYAVAGIYNVSLNVSNGVNSDSALQGLNVGAGIPAAPIVVADFDLPASSAKVNDPVSFVDRSTGLPNQWLWDFGDGQTSSLQNPTHSYALAGNYTVTLTASNGGSSSFKIKNVSISQMIERFRSLVPVATQTSGVGSTFWRTELTVYNAGEEAANLDFIYVPGAGGSTLTRSTVIAAGGTVSYANALPDLFGLSSGSGALTVDATSPIAKPDLRVSSRTFTTSSNGTYGQFVPDVGDVFPTVTYLTGIESNPDYRTNIGLVNNSLSAVNTILTLYDANGAIVGTAPVAVPGNNFQQVALVTLFPTLVGQSKSGLSMKIQAASAGAVSVYASTIDNRSQDPIFYPAIPAPLTQDVIVPAVARIPGAGGTFWRSDVTVFNPTGSTMTLSFRLFIENVDNRGAAAKVVTLLPGRTLTIQDVITWLNAGNSKGSLQIVATGANSSPIVNSRTYTTRPDGGTFGQWIDATETSAFGFESVVTGLRSDSSYRTNFGFVNSGDQPIGVTVILYNGFSQQLGAVFLNIQPKSQVQPSLANLFPGVNPQSVGRLTMRAITVTAPTLFAYGSMVDNTSGDPIFVRGK